MSGADPASSAPTAGALSVGTGTGVPGTSAANAAASSTGTPAVTLPPPGAAIPTIVPAPPGAAPAATTPKRLATAGDGLPPHGRLLYSLATSAAELAALAPPRPGDAIALKDGALEFTAGTDLGVGTKMPVEGIGDFVAVLRYVATDHRPALTFRFHVTPQNQGHAVRLPAYLHLAPPAAGARADGPQLCCQPFDLFVAPQAAGSLSLFGGPPPVSVAAGASEEQVIVVAATGPLIVVSAGGREIARVQDAAFGPGSMSLGVSKARGEPPATVRLTSLDLYEPPASVPMPPPSARAALPPHGALLYSIADHLSDFAQVPQQRPENTIAVKGTSLEITAGADVNLVAPLPVGGIADFVAVLRFAVTNLKPFLQFRFHRSPQGDHAVQIPAYLRLAPPAAGARAVGAHPCCQEFDVFVTPQAGASALLSGPQIRSVAAPANEERQVVLSVKGPLLVVYEDGQEIARASFDASRTGGMSLQVQARGHQVPAVLRLNALEIYEAAALPAAGGTFISNPRAHR